MKTYEVTFGLEEISTVTTHVKGTSLENAIDNLMSDKNVNIVCSERVSVYYHVNEDDFKLVSE